MKNDDFIEEGLIADILIRLSALENTLISSGLVNAEHLANKNKELADILVKSLSKKYNLPLEDSEEVKS